jgi:hypothetical protein
MGKLERRLRRRHRGQAAYRKDTLKEGAKLLSRGVKPGGVYMVDVYHDGWCDLLNGRGACNCDPVTDEAKKAI